MRIKNVKQSSKPVTEPTHAEILAEETRIDSFEAQKPLPARNAEILLDSTDKQVRKVKKSADANFFVTEDENDLEIAVQARELKARLREMQSRHNKGNTVSKTELWSLRHDLSALDSKVSEVKVQAVADVLCESADYTLFDIGESLNNHRELSKLLFLDLFELGYKHLEMLGVIEKGEDGKFQISETGFQVLKDAINEVAPPSRPLQASDDEEY